MRLNAVLFESKFEIAFHCMKSVCIRSFSGRYFPAFGLNTDQKNSEYGDFLHSVH